MSKDYRANKRQLRKWISENVKCEGNKYENIDAYWKLTRHPNKTNRKHTQTGRGWDTHTFGSPKHMNRTVVKKDKQMNAQLERNERKKEVKKLLKEIGITNATSVITDINEGQYEG